MPTSKPSRVLSEPEEEAPAAGAGETLLIVEVAEVVRRALAAVLAEYGYRVLLAADGSQALRLASQCPGGIDLVLADLVLPRMNLRGLAWRLDPSHAGTPGLCISGHGEALTRRQVAPPPTLTKLFDAARLAGRAHSMLAGRRPGKKSARGVASPEGRVQWDW